MTRTLIQVITAFLIIIPSTSLIANTFDNAQNYSDERELFKEAKTALKLGKTSRFKIIKQDLKHYPLYPYLEYAEIANGMRLSRKNKIEQFLKDYAGTPVAQRMQHKWLEYLRKYDQWQTYLTAYTKTKSVEQQCYYNLALYRNGEQQRAIKNALALWNTGKSQPKGCDKLFGLLGSKKLITQEIAWQRYQKALANNKTRLAKYLKRFFTSADYKAAYANYQIIRKNPSRIRKHADFDDHSAPNKSVLIKALSLLASKDPTIAHKEWRYFNSHFEFTDKQKVKVQSALIKNFIKVDKIQQADAILENNKMLVSADLLEWRIRQALRLKDWPNIRYWIKALPDKLKTEQRWQYWLARAETAMATDATIDQHPLIKILAKQRGYYAFIAADSLNQTYSMDYKPSDIGTALSKEISQNPGIIRARELYWLDEQVSAIREWSAAGESFNAKQWEATGVAFNRWDWDFIAILSMVRAKAWQDIVVRFPVLHKKYYKQYAQKNQLPTELLMAITRQESAYNIKAVSSSNARGLMQLLPSTAKYIAKKSGQTYKSSKDLFIADKNIALGSAYIKYLMDRFDNNRAVSIAGYNAGPNRANKWLNDAEDALDIDIWVETIPYSETRRYVQNVLAFSVIYSYHLGQTKPLFTAAEKQAKM